MLIFFLIQSLMINVGIAQDFEGLPNLGSSLDSWSNSATDDIYSAILHGTYFYKTDEQLISPGESPFFEGWDRNGAITYEGRHFNNINIIYNASEDLLLIWSLNMRKDDQKSLLINQHKIDSFTIHNQKFLNYRHVRIGTRGFYKKVMQGKHITCYSKFTKTGSLEELEYIYEEKSQYWIKYRDEIYEYKRISTLYKIFPEYKKQIRTYMNENRLAARLDRERFLQFMLYHCDKLL
ncbi:MAG: hypothetical protein AAF391_03115 [Bacteroidota bacterium]